ncbi:MAG: hypothetical protein IZT60_08890 [Gammaproteobacteria bacterium]|nr:hypothetical protein [Gammaproteobacteria bacterium]
MNRKQARENFSNVVSGKRRKANVDLDEAKARLRRVDEDLDISTSLHYLGKGDLKSSLFALAPLAITRVKQENLLIPLLTRALPLVNQLLSMRKKPGAKQRKENA